MHDVGKVDEGAAGGRHDDAAPPDAVALEGRDVDRHTLDPPSPRRGHVNHGSAILEDFPQNGSTEVTQRGPLSAREHRGHEASVTRKRQMANGVHAPVYTV